MLVNDRANHIGTQNRLAFASMDPGDSRYVPWRERLTDNNFSLLRSLGFGEIEQRVAGDREWGLSNTFKRANLDGTYIYITSTVGPEGGKAPLRVRCGYLDHRVSVSTFDMDQAFALALLSGASNSILVSGDYADGPQE